MTRVPRTTIPRAFRRMALPLASYYAVTLAVPLANGAAQSGAFVEHAPAVLVVPPVAIILASTVWTIAHALVRACRTAGGRKFECWRWDDRWIYHEVDHALDEDSTGRSYRCSDGRWLPRRLSGPWTLDLPNNRAIDLTPTCGEHSRPFPYRLRAHVEPPHEVGGGRGAADPNAPPRVNNGVTGDPTKSTKEIGKDLIDIIVNNGVNEIKKMTAERRGPATK